MDAKPHPPFVRGESIVYRSYSSNPEKHRNLIVRVAGYSACIVALENNLQDETIQRTVHDAVQS